MSKVQSEILDPLYKAEDGLHPVSQIIRNRKTTYASSFTAQKISKELIEEIIENALWAPTHKMTQPWRFVVLGGNHKSDFGAFMMSYYKKALSPEQFPESRYEETLHYPKNATMIAIILQRSRRIQIPEWEEIAAVSCAVQNMWLSCTAMGIAGYWDTAPATLKYCEEQIDLKDNERSLGIFYMGYAKDQKQNRKRRSIDTKLTWNIKQ